MPTDQQIAILCDIGQSAQFDADKARQVRALVAEGYVESDGESFRLTARGEKLLTDRGAGLNES
jgi:predicted transcriptional regulator